MSDTLTSTLSLREELAGVRETRNTPLDGFELRETDDGTGGSRLTFTGYASIVERAYKVTDALGEYNETVSRTAFDKTLAERADVSFLVNHEGVSMARTTTGSLRLAADSTGLHVEARFNPSRPDVQIVRAAIQDGDLNEMSFAFRAINQQWNEDYTDRRLNEVSLHRGDVSVVNYGMNPATAGSVSLRSVEAARAVRGLGVDRIVEALREVRAGTALSDAAIATLNHIVRLGTTDHSVEEAAAVLAEFMTVPEPPAADPVVVEGPAPHSLDLFRARAYSLRARAS